MTPPTPRHPQWAQVVNLLANAPNLDWTTRDPAAARDTIAEAKVLELQNQDEACAKVVWCYETALGIHDHFFSAFKSMKTGDFYTGWCALEHAEVAYGFLLKHIDWVATEVHANAIIRQIVAFQGLFPYGVFASPEFREIRKSCNICGARVMPRRPCGHRVGEIYGGVMCIRMVDELELLGIAMVEHPVQKFSVPFVSAPGSTERTDHYDYSVVRFAVNHLNGPLEPWSVEDTTRLHPHKIFKHIGKNAKCPCGSKRRYKSCCLRKSGVALRHKQFEFPMSINTATGASGLHEHIAFPKRIASRLRQPRRRT